MANTFRLKRSAVASKVPTTGDLQLGELAVNTFDGKLYTKKDNGTATIVEIGANIDNGSITYPKIQNVSATDRLLGRSSPGAGQVEEIPCTSAGRALLDDADASAQRTTLGLKTGATTNITTSTSDPTGGADGDIWIKYTI